MKKIEFDYKPNLIKHLLGIMFFLAVIYFLVYLSITNEKKLIFGNLFEFSKENASIFYLLLCILPIKFVANGFIILYKSFFLDRKIIVEEKYILAPKNFISDELVKVYYNEVFRVNYTRENKKLTLLTFLSKECKLLSISKHMLPSQKDFEELCTLIQERVKEQGIPPRE